MKKYFFKTLITAISLIIVAATALSLCSCNDKKSSQGSTLGTVVNGTFSNGEKAVAENGTYANGQKVDGTPVATNAQQTVSVADAADDKVINGTYANGEKTIVANAGTTKSATTKAISKTSLIETYFDYFSKHESLLGILSSNYFASEEYKTDKGLVFFAFACAMDRKSSTKKDKDGYTGISKSDIDDTIGKYLNKKIKTYDSDNFRLSDNYVYQKGGWSFDSASYVVLRTDTYKKNNDGSCTGIFDVYSFEDDSKYDFTKISSELKKGKTTSYSDNLSYSYRFKWTENIDSKEPSGWYMGFKSVVVEFMKMPKT